MDTKAVESKESGLVRGLSKEEQAGHLSAWEQSGLSATEYSRAHGLRSWQLYSWRRQIRKRGTAEGTGLFVPVRLSGGTGSIGGLSVTLRSAGLEFVVSGGDTGQTALMLRLIRREVLGV